MKSVKSAVVGLAVALFTLLCPSIAWASIRSIPNVRSESPSGRYRFDSVAPHNDPKNGRQPPFSNFTCTLVDTVNSRTVWTWRQDDRTMPPVGAWVHDSGWVVIQTLRDELQVIDPDTGKLRAEVSILGTFPRWEEKKFVVWTTAGPMWEEYSRWYYLEHRGELHFVVRTYWGRRVVVRLGDGRQIGERPAIKAAAAKVERDWGMKVLRQNIDLLKDKESVPRFTPEAVEMYWDTVTAMWILGMDKVTEATPLLREAETLDVRRDSMWVELRSGDKERRFDSNAREDLRLRWHAQLSLRRMGETPLDISPVTFPWDPDQHIDSSAKAANRLPKAERTARIRAGLMPVDVLRLAGEPDTVGYDEWEYHVDGDSPYTVRLNWDCSAGCFVRKVTRISPPTWTEPEYGRWR